MERRKISFVIAVVLSALVILFCAKETVIGRGRTESKSGRQYFAAMEKEYRSDMSALLNEKGYQNSGITIRWVSEKEGVRDYTVMIHHRNIKLLDEEERESLMKELAGTEFPDEGCTFCYEFLIF